MEGVLNRLEAVATRLESYERGLQNGTRTAAPAASASAVPKHRPPPPAAKPTSPVIISVEPPKTITMEDWDSLVTKEVGALSAAGAKLPEVYQPSTKLFASAAQMMVDVVKQSRNCRKPTMAEFQAIVSPMGSKMQEIEALTHGPRTPATNHHRALVECVQSLAWVTLDPMSGAPPPGAMLAEAQGGADMFINKVIMEYRQTAPEHKEWATALKAFMARLQVMAKAQFPQGLTWVGSGTPGATPTSTAPPPSAPSAASTDTAPPQSSDEAAIASNGVDKSTGEVSAAAADASEATSEAAPAADPVAEGAEPSPAEPSPAEPSPEPATAAEVAAEAAAEAATADATAGSTAGPGEPTATAGEGEESAAPSAAEEPTDKPTAADADAADAKKEPASEPEAAKPAAEAASALKGPPPPPPPPPAGMLLEKLSAAGAGGSAAPATDSRGELMAALNKGTGVTSGLKKVTDDMKTKNQTNRSGVVKAAPAAPKKDPAAAKGPTVKELKQNRWLIENWVACDEPVVLEEGDVQRSHAVYISNCKQCVVQIKGKVNTIMLDGCSKVGLVFNSVLATVEAVNCQSCQIQCEQTCPTLSIDKTDGAKVFLSEQAAESTEVVTSKCSALTVNVLPSDPQDDPIEHPVPEQFVSKVVDGKLVTTPVVHT